MKEWAYVGIFQPPTWLFKGQCYSMLYSVLLKLLFCWNWT